MVEPEDNVEPFISVRVGSWNTLLGGDALFFTNQPNAMTMTVSAAATSLLDMMLLPSMAVGGWVDRGWQFVEQIASNNPKIQKVLQIANLWRPNCVRCGHR